MLTVPRYIDGKTPSLEPITSSPGFDPSAPHTTASHIKPLTVLTALDLHGDQVWINAAQMKDVGEILLASNNEKATNLMIGTLPCRTMASAVMAMKNEATTLGLANEFFPSNPSGNPDKSRYMGRADSVSTTRALMIAYGAFMTKYGQRLTPVYENIPFKVTTNNLFGPIPELGEAAVDPHGRRYAEVRCKTATDRYQSASLLCSIQDNDSTYVLYYFNGKNTRQISVVPAAQLILNLAHKEDLPISPGMEMRYQEIAAGKLGLHGYVLPEPHRRGVRQVSLTR